VPRFLAHVLQGRRDAFCAVLALPVVERIRKCGLHHSLGLRVAANFVVNVAYMVTRRVAKARVERCQHIRGRMGGSDAQTIR
jgi:hypothetical protein